MNPAEQILLLKIRNLVAAREMNTASANRELSLGGWLSDHEGCDRVLSGEILGLMSEWETWFSVEESADVGTQLEKL